MLTCCSDWLWPAIWMLPESQTYGEWPASGEIDVIPISIALYPITHCPPAPDYGGPWKLPRVWRARYQLRSCLFELWSNGEPSTHDIRLVLLQTHSVLIRVPYVLVRMDWRFHAVLYGQQVACDARPKDEKEEGKLLGEGRLSANCAKWQHASCGAESIQRPGICGTI